MTEQMSPQPSAHGSQDINMMSVTHVAQCRSLQGRPATTVESTARCAARTTHVC